MRASRQEPRYNGVRLGGSAVWVAAILVACSGGGGQGTSSGSGSTPPPTQGGAPTLPAGRPSGAGLWYPGGLAAAGEAQMAALCQVAEDGELACVFEDAANSQAGAATGKIAVTGSGRLTGSGRMYSAPGRTFAGGITGSADFIITGGSLTDRYRSMELTLDVQGRVMTLSAAFDHYYYQKPSLAGEVSGAYGKVDMVVSAASDRFGSPTSLSVDPDGRFFMQGASGCVGNGQLGIIDADYNSYTATLTVANCPGADGDYTGLATLLDFVWVNDQTVLWLGLFSDAGYISIDASK